MNLDHQDKLLINKLTSNTEVNSFPTIDDRDPALQEYLREMGFSLLHIDENLTGYEKQPQICETHDICECVEEDFYTQGILTSKECTMCGYYDCEFHPQCNHTRQQIDKGICDCLYRLDFIPTNRLER